MLGLDHETASVEVLKIALARGLLEGISEEYLHLRDLLQVVGYLETLHICGMSVCAEQEGRNTLTLHNACELVIFVEVQ